MPGRYPKLSANNFIAFIKKLKSQSHVDNAKYFHDNDGHTSFLNARMSEIFALAKKYSELPLTEIEKLLDNAYYEIRMGAVSIMDYQARDKKTGDQQREKLFKLYLKKHNRINNWDLVDRSAPYVVGGYLFDKPRDPLYKLAKSKKINERRTAIVSTYFFIRQNQLDDTFRIAELLIHDAEDSIHKAVGSWLREAGKRDTIRLLEFLDKYSETMPRVTLRYATEKLDAIIRNKYLKR